MSKSCIDTLVKQLQAASDAYYNGTPTMSDAKYDAIFDELTKLDPTNAFLTRVGAPVSSGWVKTAHTRPMASLNKAQNEGDFKSWASGCKLKAGETLVVMDKLDGASCFTGNTPVHLANGETMPIQEIVEQSLTPYVLSWTPQDGVVPKRAVLTHNNGRKTNWVRMTLEDGSSITCTEDHLFFVEGKGWVKASELLGEDITDLEGGIQ